MGEMPPGPDSANTFGFSEALKRLKAGKRVARKGWDSEWDSGNGWLFLIGKCMVLAPVGPSESEFQTPYRYVNKGEVIAMRTDEGTWRLDWQADEADKLAADWVEVGG